MVFACSAPPASSLTTRSPKRHRLLSLATKRSRVPVIAGVSHSTLTGALQLADDAIHAGADALMLMPPYFFRYGQGEVEQFYRDFARETRDVVPILLYNIPVFTNGHRDPDSAASV